MKRLIVLLGLILLPSLGGTDEIRKAYFNVIYDLDATSYTYCVVAGQNGDPFGTPIASDYKIKTTGSSTTVVENTTGQNPFSVLGVKDLIYVRNLDGTVTVRTVLAKASDASITVDTAVDWSSGVFWRYQKQACGTTVNDGWIDVSPFTQKTIVMQIDQLNVTGGVDVQWECKVDTPAASAPVIVSGPTNYTSAGTSGRTALVVNEPWDACRVGLKIGSADDGGDTGANAEQITITLLGLLRR